MQEVSGDKPAVMSRISAIVDGLFKCNSLFRERLDQDEMIQLASRLAEKNLSVEQLRVINDDELTRRVRQILVTEQIY